MGKVFTIAEGLENMGALRTGGQGSVYKGRRTGHIITAVKLLPTPIHTESADDKNFRAFQNEVEKLKKVNEAPNPNVVKILNSGITESGSFPFIEMEFIEGPDLEELLKPPHDSVFTIREAIKVADQLSNALAHCHQVGVRHGDIKSNNVKFNIHTANYVLLDFGLAVMSDEQRRTSLRHAGAIEFMAPEQNEGQMLFQTDVYSFGIILYELLAGTVPFPLQDAGETARNGVMVAHMETPVPDLLETRKRNLPQSWPQDRRDREMQVPEWLTAVIAKCLQKNPENRFSSGMELNEAIITNSTSAIERHEDDTNSSAVLQTENERLSGLVVQYKQEVLTKEQDLDNLKHALKNLYADINTLKKREEESRSDNSASAMSISKLAFFSMLLLIVGLGAFAAYSLLSSEPENQNRVTSNAAIPEPDTTTLNPKDTTAGTIATDTVIPDDTQADNNRPAKTDSTENNNESIQIPEDNTDTTSNSPEEITASPSNVEEPENPKPGKRYRLKVKIAYFHNSPDRDTRRAAFINIWNNATLTALEERNDFIYIIYTNEKGQTSKGWISKDDLEKV